MKRSTTSVSPVCLLEGGDSALLQPCRLHLKAHSQNPRPFHANWKLPPSPPLSLSRSAPEMLRSAAAWLCAGTAAPEGG